MPTPAQLRSQLRALTDLAGGDLDSLWRDLEHAAAAEERLRDVLPALVDTYGSASAAIAADWYDELRDAMTIRGRFSAVPAQIEDSGTQSLVGWALDGATDVDSFKSLVLGGMQRRIANFARQTLMGSSIEDPSAQGWQRVSQGGCKSGFCDMLAGRGAVYSEATADFASHDNCECYAIPAFNGHPKPVKPYTPTLQNVSDADRARVREYLASH